MESEMSKAKYGFSGGEWYVKSPDGDDGYHVVSIGDSDEWTDVTFYGVKAKENASLFKASPKMYHEIERDIEHLQCKIMDAKTNGEADAIQCDIDRKLKLLAEARGES